MVCVRLAPAADFEDEVDLLFSTNQAEPAVARMWQEAAGYIVRTPLALSHRRMLPSKLRKMRCQQRTPFYGWLTVVFGW